jgi:hypothetical protein
LPSVARSRRTIPGEQLDDGILAAHWLTLDEIRERQAQHRSPLVLPASRTGWPAGAIRSNCCTSTHALADAIAADPAGPGAGGARRIR